MFWGYDLTLHQITQQHNYWAILLWTAALFVETNLVIEINQSIMRCHEFCSIRWTGNQNRVCNKILCYMTISWCSKYHVYWFEKSCVYSTPRLQQKLSNYKDLVLPKLRYSQQFPTYFEVNSRDCVRCQIVFSAYCSKDLRLQVARTSLITSSFSF